MNAQELVKKYNTTEDVLNNFFTSMYAQVTGVAPTSNSPVRLNMGINQFGASVSTLKVNNKKLLSNFDFNMYDHTITTDISDDCKILDVIYRNKIGSVITEIVVIYYIEETNTVECVSIKPYEKNHSYFGHENVIKHSLLQPGTYLKKGTILAQPTHKDDKNKCIQYGQDIKIATLTINGGTDDAVIISEDTVEKFKFPIWETYIAELSDDSVPLILKYDEKGEPVFFPEIGEKHGTFMFAYRNYNMSEGFDLFTNNDLTIIDKEFDVTLAGFQYGGEIVDVKVIKNKKAIKNAKVSYPKSQLDRHAAVTTKFHNEIIASYDRAIRFYKNPKIGYRLTSLIVEARIINDGDININYKKNQPFLYRLEFTVKYIVKPNYGYKFTTQEGCKGVVSEIRKNEEMPNGAGIIISTEAVTNRLIIGAKYSEYIYSALTNTEEQIYSILQNTNITKGIPDTQYNEIYRLLDIFYEKTNLREVWKSFNKNDVTQHIKDILKDGIKLDISHKISDNVKPCNFVKHMEINNPPPYEKVSFYNYGKLTTTCGKTRVSYSTILLLDKITTDHLASNSNSCRHITGVLVHAKPKGTGIGVLKPTKVFGESEVRIKLSAAPLEYIAETYDISNNPISLKEASRNILTADKPSNIYDVIDRDKYPLGKTIPLMTINHLFRCYGFEIKYK